MAMRGKNCVAIAADRRFGIQAQMVTTDFQKIFPMGERLVIGLAGLATDVQTVWVFESQCLSCHHHDTMLLTSLSVKEQLHNSSVTGSMGWRERKNLVCFLCRSQRLKFRLNLYELKEGRQIKPKTFMSMVSNLLYERRWVDKETLLSETVFYSASLKNSRINFVHLC